MLPVLMLMSFRTNPSFTISGSGSHYDKNLAIELGKLFLDSKAIVFIFYNDGEVASTLNSYANKNKLPGVFQQEKVATKIISTFVWIHLFTIKFVILQKVRP